MAVMSVTGTWPPAGRAFTVADLDQAAARQGTAGPGQLTAARRAGLDGQDPAVKTGYQDPPRRTAPTLRAASATAASRAALASSAVRVRSGARNRSVYASDLRPSPACAPV
jgi:hypothetical protein